MLCQSLAVLILLLVKANLKSGEPYDPKVGQCSTDCCQCEEHVSCISLSTPVGNVKCRLNLALTQVHVLQGAIPCWPLTNDVRSLCTLSMVNINPYRKDSSPWLRLCGSTLRMDTHYILIVHEALYCGD